MRKAKVLRKIVFIAAVLTFALSRTAFAHHSGAAYDMDHPQTLEGTVKTVNWTNPHITFVIEPDAKDGKPAETLVFEVSSPGVLPAPAGLSIRCSREITSYSITPRCAMAGPAAF